MISDAFPKNQTVRYSSLRKLESQQLLNGKKGGRLTHDRLLQDVVVDHKCAGII
jgi:hypothetical protein